MKPALQQREGTSYKSFMADVQSAKDRLKKKVEDRKKKDAQFVDTKTKNCDCNKNFDEICSFTYEKCNKN